MKRIQKPHLMLQFNIMGLRALVISIRKFDPNLNNLRGIYVAWQKFCSEISW